MQSLEIRTLLSVFATALLFGCPAQTVRDAGDGVSDELPEGDVPGLDDDDTADELTDDDDTADELSDDDDTADVADDDDTAEETGDDDDATGDDPFGDDDDATGDAEAVDCTDALEENDEPDFATAATPGDYANLTVCELDEDWYALDLVAGDFVTATVSFLHADGDIDARLVDGTNTTLDSSSSTSDDEVVEAAIAADGTYFLRVWRFSGLGEAPVDYDLNIDVGLAPVCPVDTFEENDEEAAAVVVTPGLHNTLTLCEDDADFFTVDVAEGQTLTVDLFFADAEGDVDLQLTSPSGTLSSSGGVDDDESVEILGAEAGSWLVRAYLFRDDGTVHGNEYDLQITLQ